LPDTREVHRLAIVAVDVIGLLALRVVRILHPFVPAICRDYAPAIPPYRLEEVTGRCCLAPGIDRWRPLTFRPERRPAPGHQNPAQPARVLMQNAHLRPRRDVVPVDRFRI